MSNQDTTHQEGPPAVDETHQLVRDLLFLVEWFASRHVGMPPIEFHGTYNRALQWVATHPLQFVATPDEEVE